MYKLNKNWQGIECSVTRLLDNVSIPFVEDNTDYQEYLEWIAEGNTPEEAE